MKLRTKFLAFLIFLYTVLVELLLASSPKDLETGGAVTLPVASCVDPDDSDVEEHEFNSGKKAMISRQIGENEGYAKHKNYFKKTTNHSSSEDDVYVGSRESSLEYIKAEKEDRRKVDSSKLLETPYCFIGLINFSLEKEGNTKNYFGTGTLVGPRHVLTCAHNLFDTQKKKWAKNITFTLKTDILARSESFTSSTEVVCKASKIMIFKGYKKNKSEYDVGLIILDKSVGDQVGWLDVMPTFSTDLDFENNIPFTVRIAGYPKDKNLQDLKDIYEADGVFTKHHTRNGKMIVYQFNTYSGQSGSPLFFSQEIGLCGGVPHVFGVHTGGEFYSEDPSKAELISKLEYLSLSHRKWRGASSTDISQAEMEFKKKLKETNNKGLSFADADFDELKKHRITKSLEPFHRNCGVFLTHSRIKRIREKINNNHWTDDIPESMNTQELINESVRLFMTNELGRAEALLLKADQENINVQRNLIAVYQRKGDLKKVEELLLKAKGEGDIDSRVILAGVYLHQGKFEEAETLLESAAHLGHENAKKNLIKYYISRNNLEKAEEWLLKVTQVAGDIGMDHLTLCDIYTRNGNSSKAESLLKKYHDELNMSSKIILADTCLRYNRLAEAERYLLKSANSGNTQAQVRLGCLYQTQNKIQEAKNYFMKAHRSGFIPASFNLGMLYMNNPDKLVEAEALLQKAAELGDIRAKNCLGVFYMNNPSKLAEAEALLKNAARLGNISSQVNLGLLYTKQNNFQEAEKLLIGAAQLGSTEARHALDEMYKRKRVVDAPDTPLNIN